MLLLWVLGSWVIGIRLSGQGIVIRLPVGCVVVQLSGSCSSDCIGVRLPGQGMVIRLSVEAVVLSLSWDCSSVGVDIKLSWS